MMSVSTSTPDVCSTSTEDKAMTVESSAQQSTSEAVAGKSSSSTSDDDAQSSCPLFMDALPSNFTSNPGLSAIASLLDEGEDNEDEGKSKESTRTNVVESGGGKTMRSSQRHRHSPYGISKKEKDKKKSTLGEAQLFLSMWKI
eukprot:scaffold1477_cov188-Alexandrium_tamarense.AAC.5